MSLGGVGPGTAPVGVSSRNQPSGSPGILATKLSPFRVGALPSVVVVVVVVVVGTTSVARRGVAGLGNGEGLSAGGEGVEVEVHGGERPRGAPRLGSKVHLDGGGLGAVARRPLDQDVGVLRRRARERVRHGAVREGRVVVAAVGGKSGAGREEPSVAQGMAVRRRGTGREDPSVALEMAVRRREVGVPVRGEGGVDGGSVGVRLGEGVVVVGLVERGVRSLQHLSVPQRSWGLQNNNTERGRGGGGSYSGAAL